MEGGKKKKKKCSFSFAKCIWGKLWTANGDGRVMLETGDILRWMCKMRKGIFYSKQLDAGMDLVLTGTHTKIRERKENKKRNESVSHVLETSQ